MPSSASTIRRSGVALLAGALTLAMLGATDTARADDAGVDDEASAHAPALQPLERPLHDDGQDKPLSVTLLTGDRVLVTFAADGTPSAVMESSADHYSRRLGDDLYVIPARAQDALATNQLDIELFNVTGLIEQGYDDASRDDIPLIVDGDLASTRSDDGVTSDADLESIDARAVSVDKEQAAAVFDDLVARNHQDADAGPSVWLDALVQPTWDLDPRTGVEQTGAPTAWDLGVDGAGTRVAVLDSGWDADHPDLVEQVVDARDFTGWGVDDTSGHGTHVAATVAGSGASDPSMVGMAPATELLIGKVLGPGGGQTSWIVDAMEWAVDNDADVVNMSLGSQQPTDCTDPLSAATNRLSAEYDTLFVIAAGNAGTRASVTAPGCAEAALTVGAVDADGVTAAFSSRGATVGEHRIKPDIAAPGVAIRSAQAGSPGGIHHVAMSGTSMASPHVAGAAALIRQANPDLTADEVKEALTASVKADFTGTVHEQGAGGMWVPDALAMPITSEPSVELATFDWPHGPDERTTHPVTWTNHSDTDVVLKLEVTNLTGADGQHVPSSMLQLTDTKVTVPATGTATVDVAVRGDIGRLRDTAYGEISGRIVATGTVDGEPVHATTAVGFWLEPKMVDVTFRALDRNGDPATAGLLDVTDLHQPRRLGVNFLGDDLTVRVRAGSHAVTSFIRTEEPDGRSYTWVGDPEVDFSADTTMVLDAREATEVTVTGDRPIGIASGTLGLHRSWNRWQLQSSVFTMGSRLFVTPTDRATTGEFTFGTYLRGSDPAVAPADSDYVYNLAFFDEGRVGVKQSHHVADRELAQVTEHWHAQRDGWLANDWSRVMPGGGLDPMFTSGFTPVRAPSTRTAWYSPDVPWQQLASSSSSAETWFDPVRTHTAGDRHEVDWFRLPTNTTLHRNQDGSAARVGERQGSLVGFSFGQWKDSEPGRFGVGGFRDVGNLSLWADGEFIGSNAFPEGFADLAPGDHDLRVEVNHLRLSRDNQWNIGRGTITRWEFSSQQPDGDTVVALPMAVPNHDAPVNALNQAPAVAEFPVTIQLEGQDGYDPDGIESMTAKVNDTIDVLGDRRHPEDYHNWVDVPVVQRDGQWVVLVDTAATPGASLSLWINAVDGNGTAIEQFTIDLLTVQ